MAVVPTDILGINEVNTTTKNQYIITKENKFSTLDSFLNQYRVNKGDHCTHTTIGNFC